MEQVKSLGPMKKKLSVRSLFVCIGVIGLAAAEGRADWIKGATNFLGHIPKIKLNGQTFANINFPFPKGTQHAY